MKSILKTGVIALCAAGLLASQPALARDDHGRYDRHDRHGWSHPRYSPPPRPVHRAYERPVVERRVVVERPAEDRSNVMAGVILGGILGAVIASQVGR